MLNSWYINNVGELYIEYNSDTEDDYEDKNKELTQIFLTSKVICQHLSLKLCTA
jgi:hypothetical protein